MDNKKASSSATNKSDPRTTEKKEYPLELTSDNIMYTVCGCDVCGKEISPPHFRYTCTKCLIRGTFDLCEECNSNPEKRKQHFDGKHDPMSPEQGAIDLCKSLIHQVFPSISLFRVIDKTSVAKTLLNAADAYADRLCMGQRKWTTTTSPDEKRQLSSDYHWMTYRQVGEHFKNFGFGLKKLAKTRDFIGICSANRPEWLIADYACITQGFVSVPIHNTMDLQGISYIIKNTNIRAVVCSFQLLPTFVQVSQSVPCLETIICMDALDAKQREEFASQSKVKLFSMEEVEAIGRENPSDFVYIKDDDLSSVVYTSGSTGFPKGAMITEKSYRYEFSLTSFAIGPLVSISFMPLAHSERAVQTIVFVHGGRTGFYSGDMNYLMEDISILRPSELSAPPRFWNMLYSEYNKAVAEATFGVESSKHSEIQKKVKEDFALMLGNRVKALSTGGAPTSPAVLAFMRDCFKHTIVGVGYGATEAGNIGANDNSYSQVKIKIIDVPEMGYYYPQGEICVKTPQMATGYLNNPEETKNSFDEEGYFRTGDIGEIGPGGGLVILDRKKSIFKLSQGEYISPEKLESAFLQSPFVDQIWVQGNSLESYPVCVIVPKMSVLLPWATKEFPTIDSKELLQNPQVIQKIQSELQRIAKEQGLNSYEIPRAVYLESEPFTAENGKLTPSAKLCRPKLSSVYKQQVEQLYSQMNAHMSEIKISDTEQKLKTLLESVLSSPASTSSSFFEIGGDSLSAVRFARKIQSEFNTKIPLEVLLNDKQSSINNLASFIDNKKKNLSSAVDFYREAGLNPEITKNIHKLPKGNALDSPQVSVLLTGATGFLGSFLLQKLIESTCATVYCIVRSKSDEHAVQRGSNNLEEKLIKFSEEQSERVKWISGDFSLINFGMSDAKYEELAKTIDIVYHCGSVVNGVLPYQQIKKDNVWGTIHTIMFACCHKLKPIHYISTIGVLSPSSALFVKEDDKLVLDNSYLIQSSGYTQSKWVAETIVTIARERGVPVTIYRPGDISGHSVTGVSNKSDFVVKILCGLIQLKHYPTNNVYFEMTPVDFLSKVIVSISKIPCNGSVFNLSNNNKEHGAYSLDEFVDFIQQYGYPMQAVQEYSDWYKLLEKSENNALEPLLSYFVYFFPGETSPTIYHHKNVKQTLPDMPFPSLTKDLLFKYLDWFSQCKWIPNK